MIETIGSLSLLSVMLVKFFFFNFQTLSMNVSEKADNKLYLQFKFTTIK